MTARRRREGAVLNAQVCGCRTPLLPPSSTPPQPLLLVEDTQPVNGQGPELPFAQLAAAQARAAAPAQRASVPMLWKQGS